MGLVDLIRRYTTLDTVRAGRLLGRCPFHEERTPSFLVDADAERWHCLGCGLGGDAAAFSHAVATSTRTNR